MKLKNIVFERIVGDLRCCENGRQIQGFVSFEVKNFGKLNRIPVFMSGPTQFAFSVPTADYFEDGLPMIDFDRNGLFGEVANLIRQGLSTGVWDSRIKLGIRTIKSKDDFLHLHPDLLIENEVIQ